MQKTKLIGPFSTVLMVLMVWGTLMFLADPRSTFAFVASGADCGLRVEASDDPVDVGNLNPGDNKGSYLTVHNDGENPLTYYFDIVKTDGERGEYRGETGKEIVEILEFIVERNGNELFQGLLSDFEQLDMGRLNPGQSEQVDINVFFPPEADNAYQGSSVTVQFAFHAQCSSSGGGGGGGDGGGTGGDPEPPDEGLEIDPEEAPAAPQEPQDEELIVEEENTPAGPGLPYTGELPPWMFYGIGLLLILAGVALGRKYWPGRP